ncbi:PE-PPE domain-containing protein [Mycolicibacillus trivialis]
MLVNRIRSLGALLLALFGALALVVVSAVTSGPAVAALPVVSAEVLLAADGDVAYVMGGSGLPNPQETYVTALFDHYAAIVRDGAYANFSPQGFNTPEGLYPYTGVKDLTLDESVVRGLQAMEGDYSQIMASLGAGDDVTVVGYSQSAILSSLFMQDMANQNEVPTDKLAFVLLGDPMNPNGGLLSRFPDLRIPSLSLSFYGATPDNLFPTDIYTLEYDGFADFPRYPLNVLSDLNAFAGIYYVHGTYPELTADQIAGAQLLEKVGDILTNYWMIPTQNLPLLEPIRSIPLVGDPVADLLQPDLTYLVNLGYGDPMFGWSTAPANVATPFGVLPPLSAFEKLPGLLVDGAQQGLKDFVGDFVGGGPNPVSLSLSALNPLALLGSETAGAAAASPLDSLTDFIPNVVNGLSGAASSAYAALLPTADIANAVVTSMPAYLFQLSLDHLLDGDLLNAVGLPLAGAAGLATMAGGFEFLVIADAAQAIIGDLSGLIPF